MLAKLRPVNRMKPLVAPLCPEHHRGNTGIHGLGSDHLFEVMWDINLKEWAVTAWEATEEMAA